MNSTKGEKAYEQYVKLAAPVQEPQKKVRIRWTKAMDDRFVSLRQEGAPWEEVAVRLGVSTSAVWSRGQKIEKKEIKV